MDLKSHLKKFHAAAAEHHTEMAGCHKDIGEGCEEDDKKLARSHFGASASHLAMAELLVR